MAAWRTIFLDDFSRLLRINYFSILGQNIILIVGVLAPIAILFVTSLINFFIDTFDPAPELVPIEENKNGQQPVQQ